MKFQKGQSGNPKGRPKGSRNKLGEAFVTDLYEAWQEGGREAIRRCMKGKPAEFIRVVANLLPKELEMNVNRYDHLTDEQLREQFASAVREAAALGIDLGGLRLIENESGSATEGYITRN